MKTNVALIFSISLLISGCGDNNPAVEGSVDKPSAVIERDSYLSLENQFDITLNNVGSNFKGHNLVELGNRLVEKQFDLKIPNKDEFETASQYEQRINSINPFKAAFGWDSKSHYFAYLPKHLDQQAIEYDADKKALNINFVLDYRHLENNLTSNQHQTTGRNAFGNEVDVSYSDEVKTALGIIHFEMVMEGYESLRELSSRKNYLPYEAITPKWLFYDSTRKLDTKDFLNFSRVVPMPLDIAKETKHD